MEIQRACSDNELCMEKAGRYSSSDVMRIIGSKVMTGEDVIQEFIADGQPQLAAAIPGQRATPKERHSV